MVEYNIERELELYKKMYLHIFNAATDVINRTDDEFIKQTLINAQQETEETYING